MTFDIITDEIDVILEKECQISDIRELFKTGDWEDIWTDDDLKLMVKSSFAFVVAKERNGHLVGMGRLISDGVSDAYLQDIVVLREFQNKGIGSRIVKKLLTICHENKITWIGIIAGPEKEFFYRRFGFAKMGGYTAMRYEL